MINDPQQLKEANNSCTFIRRWLKYGSRISCKSLASLSRQLFENWRLYSTDSIVGSLWTFLTWLPGWPHIYHYLIIGCWWCLRNHFELLQSYYEMGRKCPLLSNQLVWEDSSNQRTVKSSGAPISGQALLTMRCATMPHILILYPVTHCTSISTQQRVGWRKKLTRLKYWFVNITAWGVLCLHNLYKREYK